jgi:gas vesicle protein GvpL/GvpF
MKKKAAKGGKKVAKSAKKEDVWYAYGIVRVAFDPASAPGGLDDTLVRVLKSGRIGALVSQLPAQGYAPDVVEDNSGNVSWLSPRAMAHDRVLTWAQENGDVIPLPMFSLWASEAALTKSLTEQASRLTQVLERVSGADEFGLRVHRRDAVMLESIDDLDSEIAGLRREALAAPPGQRYLLERKLADKGKSAVRAASQRLATQIFDSLRTFARGALTRPLVPEPGKASEATLVLNAAFLVDRKRLDEFRAAVGSHVREYQPRGLAFDFTGPWPPYNFVGDDNEKGGALRSGSR